eukprot:7825377-Heterocapsa_arctica.AAC.1
MCTRSVDIADAIEEAGSRWGKPWTATFENPDDPGEEPFPSAWLLPQLVAFLERPACEIARFNMCIWGPPWWKPSRMAGCLPGLASLSGKCKCTEPHEPLR